MAGIGFSLRELASRDTLTAGFGAYFQAGTIACGPWLITTAGLGLISFLLTAMPLADRATFSAIIIYNFSFSLVSTGPLLFPITRRVSDSLYSKQPERIPALLCDGLAVALIVNGMIGLLYFGAFLRLPMLLALPASVSLALVGGIWIGTAFLGALRGYFAITMIFFVGTAAAVLAAFRLGDMFGLPGMTAGFAIGLTAILFLLVARVLAEHPYRPAPLFSTVAAVGRHWRLLAIGLFYNAGVWVDKWIMWASPGHTKVGGMFINTAYDTGTFFAMLTIIPAMAVFLISAETRLFEAYRRFYFDIANHATAQKIERNHRRLKGIITSCAVQIVVLQLVICYLSLLVAPQLIMWLGGGLAPVPIFRLAVVGGGLHVLFLFCMILLFYFDLQQEVMRLAILFFAANASLTLLQVITGLGYPGYGYLLACLFSLVTAAVVVWRSLEDLQYLTFVGNNPALRAT